MFPTLTPKFFEDAGATDLQDLANQYMNRKSKGYDSYFQGGGTMSYTCSMKELAGLAVPNQFIDFIAAAAARKGTYPYGAFIYNTTSRDLAMKLKEWGCMVTSYWGNHGADVHTCVLVATPAVAELT